MRLTEEAPAGRRAFAVLILLNKESACPRQSAKVWRVSLMALRDEGWGMGVLLARSQLCCCCPLRHICGIIALFVGMLRLALAENVAPLAGRHDRDHLGSESDVCSRDGSWARTP